MAESHEQGFLSLDTGTFTADDNSNSSPFHTLWTEFARSHHPRLSPPRTPTQPGTGHASSAVPMPVPVPVPVPVTDLRALEYVSEYDSNLMCPICHVPFIDPVVLDCDHTFCAECFEECTNGTSTTDPSRCPSCRSFHLSGSKKASRLIKNMCNDLQVRCPNQDCELIMARGCVDHHATKDCPEKSLPCPDSRCSKETKRKNYMPDQCVHSSHIECECGATIRLGRGEWIRHKDEDCPNMRSITTSKPESTHEEPNGESATHEPTCPGTEFGCIDFVNADTLDSHTALCPLARLAPYMKRQSQLLHSIQDQLTMTKLRNEALETSFDRLSELITNTIQPKLDTLTGTAIDSNNIDTASEADIEEIPRHDLPAILHEHQQSQQLHQASFTPSHQQYDIRFSNLQSHLHSLEAALSDLDARSSLSVMNETLRLREELAHLNGAMYSTRTQVQWLLNRERVVGQREAMMGMGVGVRGGRAGAPPTSQSAGDAQASSSAGGAGTTDAPAMTATASTGTQRPSTDRNMSSAWSQSQSQSQPGGSDPSSTATSPMFGAARPSVRRPSGGGSQERVKL